MAEHRLPGMASWSYECEPRRRRLQQSQYLLASAALMSVAAPWLAKYIQVQYVPGNFNFEQRMELISSLPPSNDLLCLHYAVIRTHAFASAITTKPPEAVSMTAH